MPSTYVVTGGARGIGHELVKQLLAAGHTVVATSRGPSTLLSTLAASVQGRLIVLSCDLASSDSVVKFGDELAKSVSHIDVLINNAGISNSPPAEDPSNVEADAILSHFNTNVIGTLLVTQASAPLFHPGTKMINISSMVASLGITHEIPIPSVTSYSLSKTALNMLTVKQALFYTDCVVVAMDPGLVKTDMNPTASNTVGEVVSSIVKVVNGLKKEDSGSFVSWEGKPVSW